MAASRKIQVKISRTGEIRVTIDGRTPQEVRDFRVFLEEMIGPIAREMTIRRPPWEQSGELATEQRPEITQEQGG